MLSRSLVLNLNCSKLALVWRADWLLLEKHFNLFFLSETWITIKELAYHFSKQKNQANGHDLMHDSVLLSSFQFKQITKEIMYAWLH